MTKILKIDEYANYGTDAQWEAGMGVEDWNEQPEKELMQYTEEEFLEYAKRVASWFYYNDRGGYNKGDKLSAKDMGVINEMIEYIKIHGTECNGDIYFPEDEDSNVSVTYEKNGYFMIESYSDNAHRDSVREECLYISIANNTMTIDN